MIRIAKILPSWRILRSKRLWVCVLALGILVAWLDFRFDGPRYQGKSASQWLDEMDEPSPKAAEAAFKSMGPKALPFLMRTIKKRPSRFSDWLGVMEDKHNLPAWFIEMMPRRERTESRRNAALRSIRAMGPAAAPAMRDIYEIFKDDMERTGGRRQYEVPKFFFFSLRDEAAATLVSLKAAAVPLVPDLIEDVVSKQSDRVDAIRILGEIGSGADSALPVPLRAEHSRAPPPGLPSPTFSHTPPRVDKTLASTGWLAQRE